MPTNEFDAATLRQWAQECGVKADDALVTGSERDRLVKMKEALLVLAATQDWLDGRTRSAQAARASSAPPPVISL